jgi:hypothetical protein
MQAPGGRARVYLKMYSLSSTESFIIGKCFSGDQGDNSLLRRKSAASRAVVVYFGGAGHVQASTDGGILQFITPGSSVESAADVVPVDVWCVETFWSLDC